MFVCSLIGAGGVSPVFPQFTHSHHTYIGLQDLVSSLLKFSPSKMEIPRRDLYTATLIKVCKTRCKSYVGRHYPSQCCINEVRISHKGTGSTFHLSSITHTSSLSELTLWSGATVIWDNSHHPILLPSCSYAASVSFTCYQIE